MELEFHFAPERQFYALRFKPGDFESVPFIRELRFWGVDRVPCPQLSTLAALIALKAHPMTVVTTTNGAINPAVCSALAHHFGMEIHPANYDINQRRLAGGEKAVAPVRFTKDGMTGWFPLGTEVLTWISLDDLRGPFGGHIRTNLDAFDLSETDKDLIVALCCAGKDVGQIILKNADDDLTQLLHRIGLELSTTADVG